MKAQGWVLLLLVVASVVGYVTGVVAGGFVWWLTGWVWLGFVASVVAGYLVGRGVMRWHDRQDVIEQQAREYDR